MAARGLVLLGLLVALLLAGCGGAAGEEALRADGARRDTAGEAGTRAGESAELWVTRDRGAELVLTATVPAGWTVLQALAEAADVETRYGGRFVQAIEGVEGSLARQRDWFFFVNGIEPDLGAAEVRLRPGDVAWWDFRSWRDEQEAPVVVGAFPEPFVHGFGERRRPVEVRHPPELADVAERLRQLLGPDGGEGEPNVFALEVRPDETGAELRATRDRANDAPVTFTLAGSLEAVRRAARALAADPALVRYRYVARFDQAGRLLE